ncbi:MAG TPA: hypothetical protein VI548_08055 [Chitinophagaceae bacterium]|nr:hypothetical protein [Chitinophagaceae bacterium]
MDSTSILIASLVALAIWSWILYEIIKAAMKAASKNQLGFMQIQIRLLTEMLIKNGVDKERIKEIIDLKKSYFTE